MFDRAWRPSLEIANYLRRGLDSKTAAAHPNALFKPVAFVKLFQHFYDTSSTNLQESFEESKRTFQWIEDHVKKKKKDLTAFKVHRGIDELTFRLVHDHEPLAYILGTQPFGPLEITCKKPILIPRPETEALTETLAKMIIERNLELAERNLNEEEKISSDGLARPLKILDLCCGSGCIGVLLRHRLLEASIPSIITAADVAKGAIALTRLNFNMHQEKLLSPESKLKAQSQRKTSSHGVLKAEAELSKEAIRDRIRKVKYQICQMNLFDDKEVKKLWKEDGPFDIVISNPPYIPTHEMVNLDENVRNWESKRALCGDLKNEREGLSFYKRIALLIEKKNSLLNASRDNLPSLVLEVGHNQAGKVQDILRATGQFHKIDTWKDPWGSERGVLAWKACE